MATSVNEKKTSLPWEYIPLADYCFPAAPLTHSARRGIAYFLRLLQRGGKEGDSPYKDKDNLQTLPDSQLDRIASLPEWKSAAGLLDVALREWLTEGKKDQPVVVFVAPPYSARTQIFAEWTERQNCRLLVPPSPEQVLSDDDSWLTDSKGDNRPWFLPALERVYLRHPAGLNLVRRFLDLACSGSLGPGIISCDSWAWAFLAHVWRGRRPLTMAFQAFDQDRLAACFQELADASECGQLLFRQSNNGRYVLPGPDGDETSDESSDFLQFLAAHSRGIFGVAWSVWRAALRIDPDVKMHGRDDAEGRNATHQTVWVTPWNQLILPSLPSGAGRNEAFVLHALLLHNGLSLDILQQLLSLAPNQVFETVSRLDEAGLVHHDKAIWQVTSLGYPAVRQFLYANSYLVDHF
ncbi:MAG: hypothetical protein V1706_11975 [Pseudomonadota bacterium]